MKIRILSSIIIGLAFFYSCTNKNEARINELERELEVLKNNQKQTDLIDRREKVKTETKVNYEPEKQLPKYNYTGTIDEYPIRAQLNYEEAYHSEGTGAIRFPVSGYYYYISSGIKIPLEGEVNGVGLIYLTARTSEGIESFDGQGIGNKMLGDYKGLWMQGNKSLNFVLREK